MNRGRRIFVLLYTASGAAALVYEVAWTRMLTLQLGHTVAAASTVLAAFMGGLAVGAWIAPRLAVTAARSPVNLRTYAALELVVAAAALLLPMALGGSVPLLAWAYADGTAPARFALVRVATSLALLGLPAAAMGASFPIGVVAVGDREGAKGAKGARGATGARGARGASEGAGSAAAELYAANTIGAAVGAALTGFVLLPSLGLFGTTLVGLILNLVAATGALALHERLTCHPARDGSLGWVRLLPPLQLRRNPTDRQCCRDRGKQERLQITQSECLSIPLSADEQERADDHEQDEEPADDREVCPRVGEHDSRGRSVVPIT